MTQIRGKIYKTQWTAQFAVATELTRRGYLVTLTLGNAPSYDLLCKSSAGQTFSVQVKGLTSKSFFPIGDLRTATAPPNDWFVLVYAPQVGNPLEFYIATRGELKEAREKYVPKRKSKPRGGKYASWPDGVPYQAVKQFKDKWDKLPR